MLKLKQLFVMIAVVLFLSGCASPQSIMRQAHQNFAQQNYGEAYYYLTKASRYNDPSADYGLGYLYYYGLGTKKDAAEARVWFVKAAKEKYQPAITALQMLRFKEPDPFNNFKYPQAEMNNQPVVVATHPLTKKQRINANKKSLKKSAPKKPLKKAITLPNTLHSKKGYALQLYSATSRQDAKQFIQNRQLQHVAYIHPAEKNGKTVYEIWFGQFATREAAQKASKNLPASVQHIVPWIRKK